MKISYFGPFLDIVDCIEEISTVQVLFAVGEPARSLFLFV